MCVNTAPEVPDYLILGIVLNNGIGNYTVKRNEKTAAPLFLQFLFESYIHADRENKVILNPLVKRYIKKYGLMQ